MRGSTGWKIVGAVLAVAAAAAAVYWLLCAKKKNSGCICAADDDVCVPMDDMAAETAPYEVFSDGTAADDSTEG